MEMKVFIMSVWFHHIHFMNRISLRSLIPVLGLFHIWISTSDACPSMCFCVSYSEFDCSRLNFTSIPTISGNHSNVYSLLLSFNNLKAVPNYAFQDMNLLQELYLDYNHIELIRPKAFYNLKELKVLSLQGNLLEILDPMLFQNLSQLHVLDLSNNHIRKLDSDMFQSCSSLRYLDLHKNKISVIHDTLLPLIQLQHLSLAHNPLVKLNPTVFQSLYHLQTLNMSKTRMSSLSLNLFQGSSNISNLDLSNNLFTYLNPSIVDFLINLTYFNLSGNPVNCDCRMIPLWNWTSTHNGSAWTSETVVKCTKPFWLSGKPLHTLQQSELTCNKQGRTSSKGLKIKDKLPYDEMMGWYTAATLSGMLVLFLICVALDKLRHRFKRWRRARKDRWEKFKFRDRPSYYKSLQGARHSIDCSDSISNVVSPSYCNLQHIPQTVINSEHSNYNQEQSTSNRVKTNPEMHEATGDNCNDNPDGNKAFLRKNKVLDLYSSDTFPVKYRAGNPWENSTFTCEELETSM